MWFPHVIQALMRPLLSAVRKESALPPARLSNRRDGGGACEGPLSVQTGVRRGIWPSPSVRFTPQGVGPLEVQDGLRIMETALIACELGGVAISNEFCPLAGEHGVNKASFLSPPPMVLLARNEIGCCCSRHHSIREMIWFGAYTYSMVPSRSQCFV